MTEPAIATLSQNGDPVEGLASVALVVYNGSKHLRAAIDSVLAQTYQPIELVVVDDGSTDDTWSILQSYGDRILAIRQSNGGLPSARNTAMKHSRGEFVALMDHDDICMPERIAVQVAFLRQNPEVGLCCSDFSAFNDQGPIEASHIATYYSQCNEAHGGITALYPESGEIDVTPFVVAGTAGPARAAFFKGDVYEKLAFGNFVHPPTVMVRASVARAVGPFDPQARTTCDWDWNVRVSRHCHVGHVHRALLDYRRSPSQMSGMLHRASGHQVTLEVAQRIFARDPTLMERHSRRVRGALGEFAIDAAYANAALRPELARRWWWQSVFRHRYISGLTWRTLAKLALPIHWVKHRRARLQALGIDQP